MIEMICILILFFATIWLVSGPSGCREGFTSQNLAANGLVYTTEMDGASQVGAAPGYLQQRVFNGDPTAF